jgi:hypothetical protein
MIYDKYRGKNTGPQCVKITDDPRQVSDIFGLTVSFKFIDFSFQTFLLFVPEIYTSFTSNIV